MNATPPRTPPIPPDTATSILGPHPVRGTWLGDLWDHVDAHTVGQTPHRVLADRSGAVATARPLIQAALRLHHANPAFAALDEEARQAFIRVGAPIPASARTVPVEPTTRKGNFAEIVLAEYITAASSATLPVYRLRHNTNVNQSMKGDDVLAFDLDADPVRVIVGEAKFRKTSTAAVVAELVEALRRSHLSGMPASLPFVAHHVGDPELAARIMACVRLFVEKELQIDYVGMLVSDPRLAERVTAHGDPRLRRLVLISWGIGDPEALVESCFDGLI